MHFDYSVLWQSPWTLLAYILLGCSIISLWIKRHIIVWGSLLIWAVIVASLNARLAWPAWAFIVLFSGVCYLFFHIRNPTLKILLGIVLFIMGILLGQHKVPGFYNWQIANNMIISENAIPFSLYLNFDTPLVGLLILGLGTLTLLKTKNDFYKTLLRTFPLAILGIACISGIAYFLGYIRFEPKWSSFIVIFFLNNLIFSVISQEVLFRGFVQQYLEMAFKKVHLGNRWVSNMLAIVLTSILFALVHTGGMIYLVLAFFSGLLYGTVYAKTKSIEASIFTHILLNMTHILFFTYPGLA